MKPRNINYESMTTEQLFRFAEMGLLQIFRDIFKSNITSFRVYLIDGLKWDSDVAEFVINNLEQIKTSANVCWFRYLYTNGEYLEDIQRMVSFKIYKFKRKKMAEVNFNGFMPTFKINKETIPVYSSIITLIKYLKRAIRFNAIVLEKLTTLIMTFINKDPEKPVELEFPNLPVIPKIDSAYTAEPPFQDNYYELTTPPEPEPEEPKEPSFIDINKLVG